ncbi:hypothetical protein G7Y89_g4210 [Cudoniella acicularis]|uniref:Uncharacterized protein n=1 Tax=Cudoniella acicularis TaxID=354080 RepID=A0A8H4RSX3_9HELO|nr:hypothetical protein G7Y89_g4210 [Cudoniella acicularis]
MFIQALEWILEQPTKHLLAHQAARMATPVFVQDERVKQYKEAEFYRICSRAWEFRAPSVRRLGSLNGPLRFGLNDHDIDRFAELRVKSIFKDTFGREEYSTPKAGKIASALQAQVDATIRTIRETINNLPERKERLDLFENRTDRLSITSHGSYDRANKPAPSSINLPFVGFLDPSVYSFES